MSTTNEIPSGLELLRAAAALPVTEHGIGGLLGMRIDEVNEGEVTFSLDTRTDFANPLGSVHGGICATLLDSVMGCAVHTTLGPGVGYGTLELKVNYVRTVPTDGVHLTATGRVIHGGRQVATAEGRVEDERGRLVAHGTTTCLIYPAITP
ncbi:PaaI family thioesterase [Tsukamurella ocularis]|uniref:PaaI family thioesterase n=1 Tax=Tsukamurella ocularis TaxID=1970234 RepID=UPI00216846A3|nr:PaaI family thioesterase [Tsukamurella ocularis]MCS3781825.1 acyl-CoA thioesterase [Tsukamurella ocularis]MCS3788319.1 acyl-CoA thioesterase [Tsukamurella ocularis]MCS3852039.1 acyl-CoA thioesterase [Tsukamurella ocularis]